MRHSIAWLSLRSGFHAPASLALLAAALILFASLKTTHQTALEQLAQLIRSTEQRQEKLRDFRNEENQLRAGADAYAAMTARGLFEPEHRQDWTRQLNAAAQALKLPPPEISLSPQTELERLKGPDALRLMRSVMTVELTLMHEQDLLDILARLSSIHGALLSPRNCRMDRGESGRLPSPYTLRARCELDWLTLSRPVPGERQ